MKKNDYSVWIFTLPSGLEIHLRDVPQQDIDFLNNVEQLRAKVAELEAQLAKYQSLEPVAYRYTVDCCGVDEDMFAHPEGYYPSDAIPLYALDK